MHAKVPFCTCEPHDVTHLGVGGSVIPGKEEVHKQEVGEVL